MIHFYEMSRSGQSRDRKGIRGCHRLGEETGRVRFLSRLIMFWNLAVVVAHSIPLYTPHRLPAPWWTNKWGLPTFSQCDSRCCENHAQVLRGCVWCVWIPLGLLTNCACLQNTIKDSSDPSELRHEVQHGRRGSQGSGRREAPNTAPETSQVDAMLAPETTHPPWEEREEGAVEAWSASISER